MLLVAVVNTIIFVVTKLIGLLPGNWIVIFLPALIWFGFLLILFGVG